MTLIHEKLFDFGLCPWLLVVLFPCLLVILDLLFQGENVETEADNNQTSNQWLTDSELHAAGIHVCGGELIFFVTMHDITLCLYITGVHKLVMIIILAD